MLNEVEIRRLQKEEREAVLARGVEVKRLGEGRKPPAEGVGILDFEEENKEGVKPGKYALITELTLSHWDEDSDLRKQIGAKVAEELRGSDEFKNKSIALTPKYMFLLEIEGGPWLAVRIKIAEVEDIARVKAEEWFQDELLAEIRELKEEGEEERVIRGYLLSDYYLGDAWNRVAAVQSFFERPELEKEFLAGRLKEDFLEEERLAFFFMLKTINQAPYIPQEAKVVFNQLAEKVYENEWVEIEDIEKLKGEREKIAELVKEKWGEDLRAAADHLNKRLLSGS